MYSTPIEPSYYDNPAKNLDYLNSLSSLDRDIYIRGYLQACYQFLESLIDTKNRFLNACLDSEASATKDRLLAHVKLLDMLDEAVAERVNALRALD